MRRQCRCCDRFNFAVHPVFGVFYNVKVPVVDGNSLTGMTVENMCFRRRFHSKPAIRPLTPTSVG